MTFIPSFINLLQRNRSTDPLRDYVRKQDVKKVKGKNLNVFLCLTDYRDMKMYMGVEVYFHALNSTLHGGEWSALCSDQQRKCSL